MVCCLHYSKTKGGRHENQDKCQGWPCCPYSSVRGRGEDGSDPNKLRGKESSHENQDESEGGTAHRHVVTKAASVGKHLSNAPREDGSDPNKLRGKESSHEKQDECEGRHPDQRLLSHIDPREHQPKDKPKSRPRKAAFRVTRSNKNRFARCSLRSHFSGKMYA